MFQENIRYKTMREVRRRPCFVSAQDVEVKLKRYLFLHLFPYIFHFVAILIGTLDQVNYSSEFFLLLCSGSSHSSSSSTAESFPSYWDKNVLPDFGYKVSLFYVLLCSSHIMLILRLKF